MNGDAQQIINKIIEIETKQEERHRENKEDVKVLFKKLIKLDNLPCAVHADRLKTLYFLVTVVLILGVVMGLWVKYV